MFLSLLHCFSDLELDSSYLSFQPHLNRGPKMRTPSSIPRRSLWSVLFGDHTRQCSGLPPVFAFRAYSYGAWETTWGTWGLEWGPLSYLSGCQVLAGTNVKPTLAVTVATWLLILGQCALLPNPAVAVSDTTGNTTGLSLSLSHSSLWGLFLFRVMPGGALGSMLSNHS